MACRHWYLPRSEWILSSESSQNVTNEPFQEEDEQTKEEEIKYTPADEDQPNCTICNEEFEQTFNEEKEDWMCVGAIRLESGDIVHQKCAPEMSPKKRPAEQVYLFSPLLTELGFAAKK